MANTTLPKTPRGRNGNGNGAKRTAIQICLCVPDHMEPHLPKRRRAPLQLPLEAPIPRCGETIYLSSTSAWRVTSIVHEWRSAYDLNIEIWLEYAGAARRGRHPDFTVTQ